MDVNPVRRSRLLGRPVLDQAAGHISSAGFPGSGHIDVVIKAFHPQAEGEGFHGPILAHDPVGDRFQIGRGLETQLGRIVLGAQLLNVQRLVLGHFILRRKVYQDEILLDSVNYYHRS